MTEEPRAPSTERTLSARVRVFYDLVLPSAPAGGRPHPLLIVLHGYGGSKKQMMREALRLAPGSFALASLQGVHQHLREPRSAGEPLRYGFGWLTNFHPEESVELHHQAVLGLIESAVDEGMADPRKIFLLGFSQSCALNYRFAFSHPERLRGVVGICGGLPGDWETNEVYRRTAASVFHLCGERDEFYPPSRVSDYAMRLGTRARDVELRSYDAGHEISDAMRDDVRAWLLARATV